MRYNTQKNQYSFTLTNWRNEVDVIYETNVPFEFKEGENLVLNAYQPRRAKGRLMAKSMVTGHSLEMPKWEGKTSSFLNEN